VVVFVGRVVTISVATVVSPDAPSDFIGVGETISLQATLTGCEGASGTISWSTSTPEFVTVDRSTEPSLAWARATAKVQALADGVSSTVDVTVAPIQVVRPEAKPGQLHPGRARLASVLLCVPA